MSTKSPSQKSSRRGNVSNWNTTSKPTPAPVPVPAPPPPPVKNPTSKEPSMFQRVAETAAGVAVGSAIGNLFTSAVSSVFGSNKTNTSPSPKDSEKPEAVNVCEKLMQSFLQCIKEKDSAQCEELEKEFKECRAEHNLP